MLPSEYERRVVHEQQRAQYAQTADTPKPAEPSAIQRVKLHHGAVAQVGERLLCRRIRADPISGDSPYIQRHSTDEPRRPIYVFRGISVSEQAHSER